MPSEETTLKSLLDHYEDQQIDFPTLVQLVVQRFVEIGSHQEDPDRNDWGDDFPGDDDGSWINVAVGRGIISHQQALIIEKAIHGALSQGQPEEPFLV